MLTAVNPPIEARLRGLSFLLSYISDSMRSQISADQFGETANKTAGAGVGIEDMSTTQMALGIAGAAGVAGVLGASFVITTYALPVPMIAGTIVSGGLLYAGLKGTELEILSDVDQVTTSASDKKEVVDSVTTPTEKKDVAVKATTEEKSST